VTDYLFLLIFLYPSVAYARSSAQTVGSGSFGTIAVRIILGLVFLIIPIASIVVVALVVKARSFVDRQ
jgi:hypothetical protein